MNRKRLTVEALLCLSAALGAAAAPAHTNVIMIMADDIGFECYGCYGSPYYRTPAIDRLAAEGARFTHAYAQPLCTPSRVKIMTGKYNFRNYVDFGSMDLSQATFAHAVKAAGYRTCIAGKWQLSPGNLQGPHAAGFDEYCLWHFEGGGMGGKGSRYKSPLLFQNGKQVENTAGRYGPDFDVDFICGFMERNKDQPFLVYYPMILVHNPFDPTPGSMDWNAGESTRPPLERFGDMVAYMDKNIARLTAKLDELGLRENTLVMITGDNGTNKEIVSPFPVRGEIQGGKGTMLDDGTHVAFVASWPGVIKAGTVVKTPVDFADVFPTIAEVTGAKVPADLDGQSMVPFMKGDESNARGWVFIDYSRDGRPDYRSFVYDGRHKLYSDGKFYEVPNDWLEKSPVRSPETDAVRRRLQGHLDGILAGFPPAEEFSRRQADAANQKAAGKGKGAKKQKKQTAP